MLVLGEYMLYFIVIYVTDQNQWAVKVCWMEFGVSELAKCGHTCKAAPFFKWKQYNKLNGQARYSWVYFALSCMKGCELCTPFLHVLLHLWQL